MPSLLVGLKMKSGLPKPKPVHSALPIPQRPTRPSALPLNVKTTPVKSNRPERAVATTGQRSAGAKEASARVEQKQEKEAEAEKDDSETEGGLDLGSAKAEETDGSESEGSMQIYTDWANHYLSKSGHKRLIRDLQTDVSDGVLLAEIIQVVANEKIGDIHGCPRSRAQMIQNIDACLSFLAAKGVNIQGLSAEEIGNGNLKAILGLFFSLSRFKQQQQKRNPAQPAHSPLTQHSTVPPHLASPHGAPPTGHRHAAQGSAAHADMQSSEASQSKLLKFSLGSKKTRLPGPSSRVAAADAARVGSNANRRSQVFSDKSKAPAARDSSEGLTCHTSAMTEHAPSPLTTSIQSATSSSALAPPTPSSAGNNNTAIPHPNATSKLWRSNKNAASSSAKITAHDASAKNGAASEPPPKAAVQRSMLEKLKLFNSKSTSKSPPENNAAVKLSETASNTEPLEVDEGNVRPGANANTASSPKLALKGIAQRTFSRALTAKKSSVKAPEKEKSKVKDSAKRASTPEVRVEDANDEALDGESNKRASKIASFIPKGGKVAKKEAQSGIPKPGAKNGVVKSSKEAAERPRSARLGLAAKGAAGDRGSKHSSSTSSLASTDGLKTTHGAPSAAAAGTTQSTASNTVSVQLPQNQQLHSHPNMATVAPFMYRSQEAEINADGRDCSKTNLVSIEDIPGEDPETRRLRTVKNIADLRQNLEETMSSLRGTQLTHSALDSSFDASDSNGGRSLLLSSRPHLSSSWRLGSAVPRLQAGDAPSLANGCRGAGSGRYLYSAHLRRQLTGRGGAGEGSEPMGDEEELEGVAVEMTGYMSDGDVLSKNLTRTDDVTSGYLTDGGLGLYTRRLNRLHDLSNMAAVRETLHRKASTGQGDADSWDDSSSVSSGVSDNIDNIDTDDINTSSSISSYSNTPAAQRKQPVTDAEKRVASSGDWVPDGATSGRKSQYSGQAVAHTGSWRRGMSAQVGVTSPRTKTSSSNGNSAAKGQHTAKTDDVKVSEKGCLSPPSDTVDDPKKACPNRSSTNLHLTQTLLDPAPSALSSRAPNSCSSFGFKKPPGSMVTASGATISSGSATLGKLPKSTQRPLTAGLKPGGQEVGVSLGHHDDSFLPMSARGTLQYRSLPRPGRSGAASRNGNRSSTSSIETAVLSVTNKNHLKLANQTDREKGVESGAGSAVSGRQQVSSSSPTLRRLFGGKQSKQAPVTTAENMKNSTVISNPHAANVPSDCNQGADSEQASTPGSVYSSSGPSGSLTWGTSMSTCSVPSRDGTLSTSSGPSREGTLGLGASSSAGYPSVSSMHTSSESIDQRDDHAPGRNGSARTGLSESPLSSPSASPLFSRNTLPRKQDSAANGGRNTLPKKGLRYGPAPPSLRGPDEARDWLRSHSVSGLQDSVGSSPFSPGSSLTSPTGTRFNFVSSPTSAAQMNLTGLRNNSLTQDPEQSEARLRTSCMSLDDKTRTMSRSGSFREGFEEVHGSSLSLVSSTSSIYSTNEEKSQSEIRKLRRELDASQEKVSALTTQLSANAHLVAAFEQSLGNMTIRLKSLTLTAEHKDSELTELRKTIELLKKQNAVAQAAINGVINTQELPNNKSVGPNGSPQPQNKLENKPDPQSNQSPGLNQTPTQNPVQTSTPDLRIRRQHSSDSVSSVTSHSSVGSNLDEARNRKKNKKNWLRSSFKQAFSKKKSPKSASSHSDIEEMTDSSLPGSPQLPHNGSAPSGHMIRNALSNSLLSECLDVEAETVMQLRSELREKEMKLTDIRLEALSSAHQLDQLREAMNRMQGEIEKLKVENDRLRLENQSSRAGSQASISSSPPAQSLSLGTAGHGPGGTSINLTTSESTSLDMLLDDTAEGALRKEGRHVKIYVTLDQDGGFTEDGRGRSFLIGCIGVSGKTKWDVLDGVVRRLFKEYISHVDPASQLGLSCDSVEGYSVGDIERPSSPRGNHTPELLPCGYLVGDSNRINIQLRGVSSGSVDSLVFDSLTPKPMVQRFVSLLKEHRRIILSGPSGTGKTHLASQLARFMVLLQQRPLTPSAIATFNVDHKSGKELRQYLSGLAEQCSGVSGTDCPLVVILDNLHHVSSLGEIFNGLFSCSSQQSPFIIGTMSQATSSAPNLQLHHNFRWVLCANHTEPVKGFLGRFLRRKLLEMEILSRSRDQDLVRIIDWIPRVWSHLNRFLEMHSSSDVTIGPRLFLSCPMDVEGSRVWFTDLWNYSIVPYMLEAVREGLQLYGRRAVWEDPCAWVMETYPWASVPSDWPPLLQLRPEDVGFDGYSAPRESARKEPAQSDSDADPLMNMLLRLKEAATSSSPQSYDDSDSNSNSHHDDLLDQSLESTL